MLMIPRSIRFRSHLLTRYWVLLIFLLAGCTEIPPDVNPIVDKPGTPGSGSTVADQQRQVLIEEFTGIRCVNCPAGAAAIKALRDQHGDRLVVLSIHAGFFSPPYNESRYDFRTTAGDRLLDLLGAPLGYPSAVIDRKLFQGENDLQLGQGLWPGFVNQQLSGEAAVRIDLQPAFEAGSRQLTVDVSIYVDREIREEDIRLSLALTENGIRDVQLAPEGKVADYRHDHVLRTMITNTDGNPLREALTPGAVISKRYELILEDGWLPENCQLVGFVHRGGTVQEVLQAHQANVLN